VVNPGKRQNAAQQLARQTTHSARTDHRTRSESGRQFRIHTPFYRLGYFLEREPGTKYVYLRGVFYTVLGSPAF